MTDRSMHKINPALIAAGPKPSRLCVPPSRPPELQYTTTKPGWDSERETEKTTSKMRNLRSCGYTRRALSLWLGETFFAALQRIKKGVFVLFHSVCVLPCVFNTGRPKYGFSNSFANYSVKKVNF